MERFNRRSKKVENWELVNKDNRHENKESVHKSKEELEVETKIIKIAEDSMEGNYEQDKSEPLLLQSNHNILIYLKTLNKNRAKLIDLTEEKYSSIKTIMTTFIKKLTIEVPSLDQENKMFYEILEYILILTQTFYHNVTKNNEVKRVLMQDELCDLDIWKNNNLWLFLIFTHIEDEMVKQKVSTIKKESEKESKVKAIYISTVITYEFNMKSFGISKETIKYIKSECKKKYNLSDKDIPELDIID